MKLPNFLNSGQMNSLRFQMGAPLSTTFRAKNTYVAIDLPIVERLREQGIDVEFDDIHVLDDGTLAYKGYRVLLYIRDISNIGERQSLPKYHLSYCRTLQTMRHSNRWARYVVANREDGKFLVNVMNEAARSRVKKLDVCQNCLGTIEWRGFNFELSRTDRAEHVSRFSLKQFFQEFPRDLISDRPEHTSDTAPLNEYPENWGDISEAFKAAAKHKCSDCSIRLSLTESKYLHVHHKNGQKNDCSEQNLEVLCIRCHGNQPMHGHMKNTPDFLEFELRYPVSR